ncbi:MAG: hypothetical protein B6D58_04320 [candidate division Zixibacteria bacterium 4484_95]|nr:MAG: hypothetical protein B6D58_04320 [candidate division Zixibacteria bacterium 4484_95]
MLGIFNTALLITGFVFMMMLVIEYLNVLTRGAWQRGLSKHKWAQYIIAVLLAGSPGCLGAFAVVAMYSHGVVTIGAIVAAMIATSGDEAFVMFAVFPGKAFVLTGVLIGIGLVTGWLVDVFVGKRVADKLKACKKLEIHELETCECFPKDKIVKQWQQLSLARGVLTGVLLLFVLGIVTGSVGPQTWDWKKITIVISSLVGLFIVVTVSEHFLQEHLWKHLALKHLHSIFLWTFGALLVTHLISNYLHLENVIQANLLLVVIVACLIGIIPESGPHMIFVTLFSQGLIPFSVLLASSIVQDGHGMLPLLAHSRRVFIFVKAVNLAIGLTIGLLGCFIGL